MEALDAAAEDGVVTGVLVWAPMSDDKPADKEETPQETPHAKKTPSSAPPPSMTSMSRNTILMGAGAAIALTVPPSIQAVENPVSRTLLSLAALVVVFGLGYFVVPKR